MSVNGNDIVLEPSVLIGQLAYVLFGLFLLLLGLAIFYTIAKWARSGRQVEGEILGVRRRGAQFHNVYRYALLEGGWGEATSVQGSGSLAGRGTGTRRLIRVMPEHPEEAREPTSAVTWLTASGLVLGGGWLTYSSATEWKHSPFTWAFFATIAASVVRFLWPRLMRLLKTLQAVVTPPQPWNALPIERSEALGTSVAFPGPRASIRRPGHVGAIFCIASFVVFASALIPIRGLLHLRAGTRTEGTVLWLEVNNFNKPRHARFPEVQYTAADGETVRFLDRTGANPSPYKVGDKVTVLYQPGVKGTAMIDRGARNWEPAAALLILGTLLLGLGTLTLRGTVAVRRTVFANTESA